MPGPNAPDGTHPAAPLGSNASPPSKSSPASSQMTAVALAVGIAALVFLGGFGVFVLASPSGPIGRVMVLSTDWSADWVGYNQSEGVSPPLVSPLAVGPGFCPSVNGTYPSGSVISCWVLVNLTQTGPVEAEVGGIYVSLTPHFLVVNVLADWNHFCLECYSWDLSIQLPPQPGTYAFAANIGLWGGPG
ncbi:MAG: hypothetical protein WA549_04750 [Thermoplasmata archaeon]